MVKEDILYIVMPAYNEAKNLPELILEWYPWTETSTNSRILIVNDGSKDDTIAVLTELQKSYPKLIFINKKNSGHGPSVTFAYKEALNTGADFIFQTDSDCQTRAEDFYDFWNNRNKYDVQLGYRFDRKDGVLRKFVSLILSKVIRILFNENIKDANVPFRLYNKQALEKIIKFIPDDFALSNVLCTIVAKKLEHKNELTMSRHKIVFFERQAGNNTINIKSTFKFARKFINQSMKWKKDFLNDIYNF